jgi:hypothetical protein
MKGDRIKLKDVDEWDQRYAKDILVIFDRPRISKKTKRRISRRIRRSKKSEISNFIKDWSDEDGKI